MPGLHTLVALLTGVALAGAPVVAIAAPADTTEDPSADAEAVPEDAGDAGDVEPKASGEEPPPEFTKPEPEPEPAAAPTPAPAPAPAKQKKQPKVDPLGLGLAVGGYALLVVSVGLFAGMGVRLQRGKNANEAIENTTTPDTEPQRVDAFANGDRANEGARNFGIAAGVVLVAGIALVATGHVLMKRRKPEGARAQLTPSVGPQGAGLTWRLAF